MKPIKVLIVDDSALVRQVLTSILGRHADIDVVGAAADPYRAWGKIQALNPDVITLDVEMPKMDGLTFLEKLMRAHPMPVLMVSSLTESGCQTTLRALELGAVDFVTKPKIDIARGTAEQGGEILTKLRAAAVARVKRRPAAAPVKPAAQSPPAPARFRTTHRIIAVGASTGGTEALREFLSAMPADSPGIVIVQHMPAGFTKAFAARLDSICRIRVAEASGGERVLPGHALIAPGDFHLEVARDGANTVTRVHQGPRNQHHRPSVDVLFHSCARHLGANAAGVIMTGMGGDGARGLLAMRQAGARTFAQDEATCVVYGMPAEAVNLGAAGEVLPLQRLAPTVLRKL